MLSQCKRVLKSRRLFWFLLTLNVTFRVFRIFWGGVPGFWGGVPGFLVVVPGFGVFLEVPHADFIQFLAYDCHMRLFQAKIVNNSSF